MIWLWSGFIAFVLVMLALDLFVVNRNAHEVRSREALAWTGVTVILSLLFAGVVYMMYSSNFAGIADQFLDQYKPGQTRPVNVGHEAMMQYLAGWLLEYSLSVDNLFVFSVVFAFFKVPARYQHRVLFWGILGALIMRGLMIWLGAELMSKFTWINYIFGGILILTAIKLLLTGDEDIHPDRNIAVRIARRLYPVSPGFDGEKFFTHIPGPGGQLVRAITPLFLVLLVVETTDVVFAVDSIPAVFSITRDPFLVFTSNVFAILGLRSLYFALAAVMDKFRYLKVSLVFVLAFVGVKMIIKDIYHIPTSYSLGVILTAIALGMLASMVAAQREARRKRPKPVTDLAEIAEEAWRRSRRIIIFVIGITITLFGLAFGLLPGPGGIPIVLAGLAILATEFVWAKRILDTTRKKAEETFGKGSKLVYTIGIGLFLVGGYWAYFEHAHWGVVMSIAGAGILVPEVGLYLWSRRKRRLAAASAASQTPAAPQPPAAEPREPAA